MGEIRELSLEGKQLIGGGGMGDVYRLDDERILKLYREGVTMEEIRAKKKSAREIFVKGVPTAISFEAVTVGSRCGLIFELLDCVTVGEKMSADKRFTKSYAVKMAELLRTLHETHCPGSSIPDIKWRLHSWIDIMRDEYGLSYADIELLRRVTDSLPDRDTLLHCDFHEGNVMVNGDELMLIDIDDMCIGHPVVDFAFHWANHIALAKRPDLMERSLGLDPDTAKWARTFTLREYPGVPDRSSLSAFDKRIIPLAMLFMVLGPARLNDADYMSQKNIRIATRQVLPVFRFVWKRILSSGITFIPHELEDETC